jgi:hypothetical protein
LPKVEPMPANLQTRSGKGRFVIAAPLEVDGLMRQVKKGHLTTIDEIRRALAQHHRATLACPMTTGMFANFAAQAAADDEAAGKVRVTPYWRTLKAGGELNPKFPGGLEVLRARLEAEGHTVHVRGKRMFVVGHEACLAALLVR